MQGLCTSLVLVTLRYKSKDVRRSLVLCTSPALATLRYKSNSICVRRGSVPPLRLQPCVAVPGACASAGALYLPCVTSLALQVQGCVRPQGLCTCHCSRASKKHCPGFAPSHWLHRWSSKLLSSATFAAGVACDRYARQSRSQLLCGPTHDPRPPSSCPLPLFIRWHRAAAVLD